MPDLLISTLLCAAVVLWYWQCQQAAEPIVTICGRCGDLVQHTPGWPTRCPSCGAFTF